MCRDSSRIACAQFAERLSDTRVVFADACSVGFCGAPHDRNHWDDFGARCQLTSSPSNFLLRAGRPRRAHGGGLHAHHAWNFLPTIREEGRFAPWKLRYFRTLCRPGQGTSETMSIVRSRGAFRPSYPFGCKARLFSRRIAVNVLAWGPWIYMARFFLNRVASPGATRKR